MLKKNKLKLFCAIIVILIGISIKPQNKDINNQSSDLSQNGLENDFIANYESLPEIATSENYNNIESIIEAKISDFSSKGYFSQLYEPSLQAVYYALYVLDAIGKIDSINKTAAFNYIMSDYDSDSGIFMDDYAYRYLGTDFSKKYYPLTTVLEVNCYAILSLEILNKLDQINSQDFVDFIWSCYNPVTSGFLGQPYSATLTDYFITSTMDNTYYAVQTLDLLIDSWSPYTTERNELVQFVNDLQLTEGAQNGFGGFYNDAEVGFDSLSMPTPNLLGSFYCVKTLEVFGLIGTININDYHQYLGDLYDSSKNYFKIESLSLNRTNIVATALGIELSDLTGAPINVNSAVDFVLNNRNSQGLWERATESIYHELIDVFQIVRSLNNFGAISLLTANDKNQMASSLKNYESYRGYSLISNDYMSMELISTIVNSFDLFDRTPDLDILGLYDKIKGSYFKHLTLNCEIFYPYMPMDQSNKDFRSFPIEYHSIGNNELLTTDIEEPMTNKWTFMALDALQQIFKLDDFEIEYDLTKLLNNILSSQFLEVGYDYYGAFLPSPVFNYNSPDFNEKRIIFEYSYYAIKILELLADFLGLGSVSELSFNKGALYTFIINNIVEDASTIYFDPQYTNNIEIILQNTFYMAYILKALNLFDLNSQKISNFILQNLDYTNIKNIYYSYKISEILDIEIDFDFDLTHSLVETLYSESLNEYYLTSDMEVIDQEILYWICDMAKNDDIKIDCNYTTSIELGHLNSIKVSFNNIILSEFGPYVSVKFESAPFGTLNLERQLDNSYLINFIVPIDPSCYPLVEGMLNIYEGSKIIGQVPVSFQTIYDLTVNHKVVQDSDKISFEVNMSYVSSTGPVPVYNTIVFVDVFIDETYLETQNFSRQDFEKSSIFTLDYKFNKTSDYYYIIVMNDDLNPTGVSLFDLKINSSIQIIPPITPEPGPDPDPDPEPIPDDNPNNYNWIIVLVAFIIGVIVAVIAYIYLKKIVEWFNGGWKKRKKRFDVKLIIQKEIPIKNHLGDIKDILDNF